MWNSEDGLRLPQGWRRWAVLGGFGVLVLLIVALALTSGNSQEQKDAKIIQAISRDGFMANHLERDNAAYVYVDSTVVPGDMIYTVVVKLDYCEPELRVLLEHGDDDQDVSIDRYWLLSDNDVRHDFQSEQELRARLGADPCSKLG